MRIILLLLACSSPARTCAPDAGDSCKCTTTDTVRPCTDKNGASGLQFCDSGFWSDCADFADGGRD